MGTRICCLLGLLLFSNAALADELPNAPSHKLWDTPNKILFIVHVGLEATDFGITHHNLSRGGTEMNPMAKNLCESGTAGQLVFFGGRIAGLAGITYLLHRTGHHKMERAFLIAASVDSAYGVTYSFAHK
jgi:hypothetical protein